MREYKGEPPDLTVQKIPSSLAGNEIGNEIGKVARIRRVPGSKESPNDLAPVARFSPRIPASVPPHFLDNRNKVL
jgi:hypothetical protein